MVDVIGKGMNLAGDLATGIAGGGINLAREVQAMTDAGVSDFTEAVMPKASNLSAGLVPTANVLEK